MHAWAGLLLPHLRWLVLAHVVSAFALLVAHAPSMAIMMRLRRERDPGAMRALLDLSRAATAATWAAWGFLAATGALLAALEHAWGAPWAWGSALVLLLVSGAMSPLAAQPMNQLRFSLGLPYWGGRPHQEDGAQPPADIDAARAALARRAPWVMAIGLAGALALLWLMVLRPTF